ncbi:MAG: MATE family efflux transporter [Lachnospira pectinoschiza]
MRKNRQKCILKVLKCAYFGDWICNIPLFFLAPFIASWFNLSGEATQITVMILRCFNVVSLFIWPLSFTLSNPLRAAGDVKFTMTASIISMWLFRVGRLRPWRNAWNGSSWRMDRNVH